MLGPRISCSHEWEDNKDNKDNMDNEDRFKQSLVKLPKLLKGQSRFFLLLIEVSKIKYLKKNIYSYLRMKITTKSQ